SVQLANVQARYPEGTVTQFVPAKQVDLANRFNVKFADGTSRFVTVDPYTGAVLGTIDRSDSWYQLANDIHGELLMGEYG
ncbi:PepSY domain-containing protein, partial [Vibrio vulnificus]